MAEVRIRSAAVFAAATSSPLYYDYADDRASLLRKTATEVFNSQQVHHNEERDSETTPPKYLKSWKITREGTSVFLINEDPAAMWVEFGAHAGGETPVLRYKPLTRALEIVGNSL